MKRTNTYLTSLALALCLGLPACKQENGNEPDTKKQEQVMPTISYQLTLPSSTDEIAPSELETLRKLFSEMASKPTSPPMTRRSGRRHIWQ